MRAVRGNTAHFSQTPPVDTGGVLLTGRYMVSIEQSFGVSGKFAVLK